jgi:ubiquinone/menaquinone biosynthesis C-methylase UbiE
MSDAQTRAYYDDFSEGYEAERRRGYHALIDDLEVESVRRLAEEATVLEVGCGTGLILERLAEVAKTAQGIDLSPGMLERARARGLDVREASATEIPFEDDTFDLVCSFKVLAHVPEIGAALTEMARVTKPGGHLALEFYNPWSLRYLAKRVAGPQPISDGRTEADVYTRWDSPLTIPKILPAGVDLVDVRGVRVVTPFAAVHRVVALRALMRAAEVRALRSRFRWLGGFLIAIAKKRE